MGTIPLISFAIYGMSNILDILPLIMVKGNFSFYKNGNDSVNFFRYLWHVQYIRHFTANYG